MKLISLFALVIFSIYTSKAQPVDKGSITVDIKNENHNPIENATIELLRAKDSSLVKVAISNNKGFADFSDIHFGNYFVKITSVNYEPGYSSSFELSAAKPTIKAPLIVLHLKSAKLKEVVVEGKKPFIQKLSDRIVVNVDNSILNAGSSAMEVLERSPGVNDGVRSCQLP